MDLARAALADPAMKDEMRERFAAILAVHGTAADILEIIEAGDASDALFSALAKTRPLDELRGNVEFVNSAGRFQPPRR